MAYNTRAPQGGKKNPGKGRKKVGGPSAKHRGFTAEAEPTRGGKKPRWTSEQRVAQGRGAERPRGQRREQGDDARPNWEPRGKDARASVERAPAARKRDGGFGARRDERGYDRPREDREGHRGRDGAPRSHRGGDRPHRLAGDRPQRHGYGDDRPRYEERPRREERPRYESDRPRYESDRPRYDERRDERPRRDDRRGGFREERPRREYSDRPRRDDAERAPRPMVEDVVLERLEAQATLASDVEGVSFGDLGLGQNIVRQLAELGA